MPVEDTYSVHADATQGLRRAQTQGLSHNHYNVVFSMQPEFLF